jgi:hypothetical protein
MADDSFSATAPSPFETPLPSAPVEPILKETPVLAEKKVNWVVISLVSIFGVAGVVAGVYGIKIMIDQRNAPAADTSNDAQDNEANGDADTDGGDETDAGGEDEADVDATALQAACLASAEDYPSWILNTDIVAWMEGSEYTKIFTKYSPAAATEDYTIISAANESIASVDIVNSDAIGYAINVETGIWEVGILNMMGGAFSTVYTAAGVDEMVRDLTFIDAEHFLVITQEYDGSGAAFKYVDTDAGTIATLWSAVTTIYGREGMESDDVHVGVSPDLSTAFMIITIVPGQEGIVRLFDLGTLAAEAVINDATHPVWVGNDYILYRNPIGGVYLYDVVAGTSVVVPEINASKRRHDCLRY